MKLGVVAAGRGYRSWPMTEPLIDVVELNGVGTHSLPDLAPADLITTWDCDKELRYGGDDQSAQVSFTGSYGTYNGHPAGGLVGGDVGVEPTVDGSSPACIDLSSDTAIKFTPFGLSVSFAADTSLHTWDHGYTIYYDFWVNGTAGDSIDIEATGDNAHTYVGTSPLTLDGTWQHFSQYIQVNEQLSAPPPPDPWANFSLKFSGGASPMLVKRFRFIVDPKQLPVHALTSDGGTTFSLIDGADNSSVAALSDASDSTRVYLDRRYVFDFLVRAGETNIDPVTFFEETSPHGRTSWLEYTVGASSPPHAARLMARTGGYFPFDATTPGTGKSRFGISAGGSARRIGELSAQSITEGTVQVNVPPDPAATWMSWNDVKLRMGYHDVFTDNAGDGLHAADYGGFVTRARFEVCRISPFGIGPVSFSHIRVAQSRQPQRIH
jgi:hypothetical protein